MWFIHRSQIKILLEIKMIELKDLQYRKDWKDMKEMKSRKSKIDRKEMRK